MGQSNSSINGSSHRYSLREKETLPPDIYSLINNTESEVEYISEIPDECLAIIFHSLSSGDRKSCSLVSKRWLLVEGQNRHRIALNAKSDLFPSISNLFTRFDSVTKLALRCDRRSVSVNDDAVVLISTRVPNLTRLKLRGCREVTEIGMGAFARNCKVLKKFSCGSCTFGARGLNALLSNCSSLEDLSVKRLRNTSEGGVSDMVNPGLAGNSLKTICLKELYNGQCFAPLIIESKKLKTLKLMRCLGDWDRLLEKIAVPNNCLIEIHLERIQVTDVGLSAIANCVDLEILHVVKTPECTNEGVVAMAEKCRLLRKLHIDGWRTNRIGDEGLMAIAKNSGNLQELVLIGVNPNSASLDAIATNCTKLERLALCGSETIADEQISCIAAKCNALKKLCIKGCPVSDSGIEAFAWGCPNLVKIKVKKCRAVTGLVSDWLKARRGSLVVNLDVCEVEPEVLDASASDSGAHEDGIEFPPIATGVAADIPDGEAPASSRVAPKSRFGLFGGRNLVACTFRRWSNNTTSNYNASSSTT